MLNIVKNDIKTIGMPFLFYFTKYYPKISHADFVEFVEYYPTCLKKQNVQNIYGNLINCLKYLKK